MPGTDGVDAFAFDWNKHNNLLAPPIYLVSRVINYVLFCKAMGTLIIPWWFSAPFWPMLVGHSDKIKYFMVDSLQFGNARGIFVQGSVKSIFNYSFKSPVLALKLDGTRCSL